MQKRVLTKVIHKVGTPCFVYEEKVLVNNIQRILNAAKRCNLENRLKIYTAYFTNSNPHLHRILERYGAGILLQSQEELKHVQQFHLHGDKIVSPSFLSDREIDEWVKSGIHINLASLEEVSYFVQKYPKQPLNFRVDLTSKGTQRTGIKLSQLHKLAVFLQKKNITPTSFHAYAGTGSTLPKMQRNLTTIIKIYKKYFPNVRSINLGGGFNYNYKATTNQHFSWKQYFSYLQHLIRRYNIPKDIVFIIEPGREVFADSGTFLVTIKRIVRDRHFINISTNGSYVYMPSATVKSRQHHVDFYDDNFSIITQQTKRGKLSGCTTLSSDYLFPGILKVPNVLKAGNIIAIKDIGAYGSTQHMEFLNKKPCPEVLISRRGSVLLLSKRGKDADKLRYTLEKPATI